MYGTLSECLEDWKEESRNTRRIFGVLSKDSLTRKVSPEGRTLGFLAWHIVLAIPHIGKGSGLHVEGPGRDTPQPDRVDEIITEYERSAESLSREISRSWDDSTLHDEIDIFGEKWSRAKTMNMLIKHEIHHRAQMTILMRQAGLPLPGIYGPSREEWEERGKSPLP